MDAFGLPDLTKWPNPLTLCKQGDFQKLFQLYDIIKDHNIDHALCGYNPSDFLYYDDDDDTVKDLSKNTATRKDCQTSESYKDASYVYQAIHFAVVHNDLAAVRKMVEQYGCSPKVNAKCSTNFFLRNQFESTMHTPLVLACRHYHTEIVCYLIKEQKCGVEYCNELLQYMGELPQTCFSARRMCKQQLLCLKYVEGKKRFLIVKIIMKLLSCTKMPRTLLVMAMQHGNYDDLVTLGLIPHVKSIFCSETDDPNYSGPVVTAVMQESSFEMLEQFIKRNILRVNISVIFTALCSNTSIEKLFLLLNHCHVDNVMVERRYYDKPKDQECLFFTIVTYLFEREHSDIVAKLTELSLRYGDSQNSEGKNLLHFACIDFSCFNFSVPSAEVLVKCKPYLQCMKDCNLQLPLHRACDISFYRQNEGRLVALFSECCEVNSQDKDGNTPLHIACIKGNWKIAEFLVIYRRASVTIENFEQCSSLDYIFGENSWASILYLVDNGIAFKNSMTLLYDACRNINLQLIRCLANIYNKSIAIKNSSGDLPIHLFLKNLKGNSLWKEVRMNDIHSLCSEEIVNVRDGSGNCPLHIVCSKKWNVEADLQLAIIDCLVNDLNASIEMTDDRGNLPLHLIFSWESKQFSIVKELKNYLNLVINSHVINAMNSIGETVLHIACKRKDYDGHFTLIKYLVEDHNASVNTYSTDGKLPVHDFIITQKYLHVNYLLLNMLLNGIDINTPTSHGNTPLHVACVHCPEIVFYLVKQKGALITALNKDGQLPLHLILQSFCNDIYAVNLLITDANLLVKDNSGNTPLHFAWESPHFSIERMLIPIAIDLNFTKTNYPLSTMKIRSSTIDHIIARNNNNMNPLRGLIGSCLLSELRYFLEVLKLDDPRYSISHLSDINMEPLIHIHERPNQDYEILHSFANPQNVKLKNNRGQTIFHVACDRFSEALPILKALPMSPDSINMQDSGGMTPLHIACRHRHKEAAIFILAQKNCVHNIQDDRGNIPLHYCAGTDFFNVLPIIEKDLHTFNNNSFSPIHAGLKAKNIKFVMYLLQKHSELCEKILRKCPVSRHCFEMVLNLMKEFYEKIAKNNINEWYKDSFTHCLDVLKFIADREVDMPLSQETQFILIDLACTIPFIESYSYIDGDVKAKIEFPKVKFSFKQKPFSEIDKHLLLHAAARTGRTDILEYIIEHTNCDFSASDESGCNVLSYSCGYNAFSEKIENLSPPSTLFLIDKGFSIFSKITEDSQYNLYEFACHTKNIELIKILTSKCYTINCLDKEGNTPLMILLNMQEQKSLNSELENDFTFLSDALMYLIRTRVCSQKVKNRRGYTALHLALSKNLPFDIIAMLDLSNLFTIDSERLYRRLPFELALEYCNFDTIQNLVNKCLIFGCSQIKKTAFLIAMLSKKLDAIQLLMKFVSIEEVMTIVQSQECIDRLFDELSTLTKYCICHAHEHEQNMKYLYEITPIDACGNTLLHKLCEHNCSEAVTSLQSYWNENSDFFAAINAYGNTPFHVACNFTLYECICNDSSKRYWNKHPEHVCCKNFTLNFLLDTRYTDALIAKNSAGELPLTIALKTFNDCKSAPLEVFSMFYTLVKKTIDKSLHEADSELIVHLFCRYPNIYTVGILRYLKKRMAELDCILPHDIIFFSAEDCDGNTPLHIGCMHGNNELVKFLILEVNADVLVVNKKKETPLHKACSNTTLNSEVLKLLLSKTPKFTADENGNYPLHMLCKHFCDEKLDWINIFVKDLHKKKQIESLSDQNDFNETPLHFLCKSSMKNAYKAVKLLIPYTMDFNVKNLSGDTPLMLACLAERRDIIKVLASQSPKCDISIANDQQETPLHLLCKAQLLRFSHQSSNEFSSEADALSFLEDEKESFLEAFESLKQSTINVTNTSGDTPLHILLRNDSHSDAPIPFVDYNEVSEFYCSILEFMLDSGASLEIKNKNGEYPLHIACQYQDCEAIELVDEYAAAMLTANRDSILHCAFKCKLINADTVRYLLEELSTNTFLNLKNNDGNTPLHLLCKTISERSFPFYQQRQYLFELIIEKGGEVNSQNIDGNTPLHLLEPHVIDEACLSDVVLKSHYDVLAKNKKGVTFLDHFAQTEVVTALVKSDLNIFTKILSLGNKDLLLRLFLSDDHDIIMLLKNHQVNPNILYEARQNFTQSQLQLPPIPVTMMIIGDAMTGKTTLVNSLKRETGYSVEEQEPKRTAGIFSSSISSRKYGVVTVYDFAGQREYYASHDAVMHSILQKLPPIVILTVKLNEALKDIESKVLYWSNFIENRLVGLKSHLILVFSFADKVNTNAETRSKKIYESLFSHLSKPVVELVTYVTMDCRSSNSDAIKSLVTKISQSCSSLRHRGVVNFDAHCLYVLLTQHWKDEIAMQLDELMLKNELKRIDISFSSFLTKDLTEMFKLCQELSSNGLIMFIPNNVVPQRSWIILNKKVLLNKVTGKLFAPSEFSEHEEAFQSGTGVVNFSTIKSVFPDLDPNMILSYLQAIEYCYEIKDDYVMQELFHHTDIPQNDKCFFFPALVKTERPMIKWNECESKSMHCGWVLKCEELDHHFTPSIIQALFLRLAFSKTKIITKPVINKGSKDIQSVSRIWKSGLHWFNGDGSDTIIDVVDISRKVVVLMRCDSKCKVALFKQRAAIIDAIRNLSKELCPALSTAEYFVHPFHIPQCLDILENSDKYLIPAVHLKDAIEKNEIYVTTPYGNSLKAKEITLIDVNSANYSAVVKHLLDKDNTSFNWTGMEQCMSEIPSLRDLTLLSWTEKGERKEFRLVNKVSAKWMEFGILLGIVKNELDAWKQEFVGKASSCWNNVMNYWLCEQGLKLYPPTWEGLYQLLYDAECAGIADELRNAVKCACTS